MKKQSEKPPIDDLFARKLGNMSLPPGADAFERLQARMNKQKPETKLVFWRDPSVQRYMAVAACLLLVCLFGWQYWPVNSDKSIDQVAATSRPLQTPANSVKLAQRVNESSPVVTNTTQTQTTRVISPDAPNWGRDKSRIARTLPTNSKANRRSLTTPAVISNANPTVAVNATAGSANNTTRDVRPTDAPTVTVSTPSDPAGEPKALALVAQTVVKPAPVSERVLVVTIAEPATLVAARVDAESVAPPTPSLAGMKKEEPKAPTKIGNLWQQVKRVKSGEAFASRNTSNDERGLLGRAYTELKQTLDKDKPLKQ